MCDIPVEEVTHYENKKYNNLPVIEELQYKYNVYTGIDTINGKKVEIENNFDVGRNIKKIYKKYIVCRNEFLFEKNELKKLKIINICMRERIELWERCLVIQVNITCNGGHYVEFDTLVKTEKDFEKHFINVKKIFQRLNKSILNS